MVFKIKLRIKFWYLCNEALRAVALCSEKVLPRESQLTETLWKAAGYCLVFATEAELDKARLRL